MTAFDGPLQFNDKPLCVHSVLHVIDLNSEHRSVILPVALSFHSNLHKSPQFPPLVSDGGFLR